MNLKSKDLARPTRLLGLISILALATGLPGHAEAVKDCRLVNGVLPEGCIQPNNGLVIDTPVAGNLEPSPADQGPEGFSITVGGTTIAGDDKAETAARRTDLALDAANVQVRFDGINDKRRLNVATSDLRSEFGAGDTVTFRASSNYAPWIDRAEVRITPVGKGERGAETLVVPVELGATAAWTMPAGDEGDYTYVLRVYDQSGRFDETIPEIVSRREQPLAPVLNGNVTAAGEGEDNTARRNIPVSGGTVTVNGFDLPPGASVLVMGRRVPVDPSGSFVTSVVLPAGEQNVKVVVSAPGYQGTTLTRQIDIPQNDWFVTALADLTVHKVDGAEDLDTKGRLAFYAKGIIKGTTRVTAAFDSGEDDLDNLFADVLTKDPRAVLDRINPADMYPTYGDDSTIVEDAPTSGKLYAKVEFGQNYVMWGDFQNRIDYSAWLSASRDLYGAQAVFLSPEVTAEGDARTSATLYAAQPNSLPQRDQLIGTGGSVYVLKRRDVVPGSEKISVEFTDPVTGRVLQTRQLVLGKDYRINHFQGTVVLDAPLASSASDGGVIGGGATGDLDANLVVQYEYVPAGGDVDGAALGGRAETWLPGERVRLGFTVMDETTDVADLTVAAADVRLLVGQNSWVEVENAQSEGDGFGRSVSSDGGFTWVDLPGTGSSTQARALRLEGEIDLADVSPGLKSSANFYYQDKEAGFTTLSENLTAAQTLWGIGLDVEVSDRLSLGIDVEDFDSDDGNRRQQVDVAASYALTSDQTVEVALSQLDEVRLGDPDNTGARTDFGLRWTRELAGDQEIYAFAQGTLDRSGGIRRNDRAGLGGRFALSQTLFLEAEASDGTNGFGGRALLDFRPNDSSSYYLGYELDPNREVDGTSANGAHEGTLIAGVESKINERVSYFAENTYDLFGNRRSVTDAFGVTYTPSALWTYSGSIEVGKVRDINDGDIDRKAVSFGVKYDDGEGVQGRGQLEYRIEDEVGVVTRDRRTLAFTSAFGYQIDEDWRLLATIDALVSESDQADFLDGRYIETSFGFAYRPVENDRLNLIGRYTYLEDLPGSEQVSADGSTAGDQQRSHILSLDGIYEIDANWELGGKLAYRMGETAARGTSAFTSNDATLAALRATYLLENSWEVSGEARILAFPWQDSQETGFLVTVYRSINENTKVGLGYNFGRFSDDLSDTTLDEQGLFLNVQAKF